jgi:hypothetical protein
MPKATITYTLPEERDQFETACNGHKFKRVISTLLDELRSEIKYNSKKRTKSQIKLLESYRQFIITEIYEHNLSIENI